MTVKELKEQLELYPDDLPVIVLDDDGKDRSIDVVYRNISIPANSPGESDGVFIITN